MATLTGSGPADYNKSATLTLYSTLRKGRLLSVDILDGGQGYAVGDTSRLVFEGSNGKGAMARIAEVNASTGAITHIEVLDPGEGYFADGLTVAVQETTGTGAVLRPLVGSGVITVRAELESNAGIYAEVGVSASGLHVVEENSTLLWLDRYFGTFNSGTIDMSADLDGDNLTNMEELVLLTNPNWADSDGDGLNDFDENNTYSTNPLLADTDGDGLSDKVEITTIYDAENNNSKTDPLVFDTDGDGWSDGAEVTFGLDPTQPAQGGAYASGYIYFYGDMGGKLYVTASISGPDEFSEGDNITAAPYPYQTFDPAAATYYYFSNLPKGITYKLFAFIDRDGDKIFDNGEPSGTYAGSWDGVLSGDRAGINFVVTDPPPMLVLLPIADVHGNESNETVYLNPGDEVIHLKPYASDAFDGEISAQDIQIGGNASEVISITEINASKGSGILKVADSAPNGVYRMVYSASDKAGSVGTAERTFVITDNLPPDLNLTGNSEMVHEAGTAWIDPWVTAIDAVDGNLSADVNVSGTVGTVLQTYYLTYSVSDKSGNKASVSRTVIVADTMPPVLTLYGDETINLNKGEPFFDPGYAAADAYKGDLTAAVVVTGLESVDVNTSGTYVINYEVQDSSNLSDNATRTIHVEEWGLVLSGRAMDGYLVGANVIFDIDGNGTHALSKPVITDENGAYQLAFTKEELAKADLNFNGIIDFDEGRIRVSGGIDASTLEPFVGEYQADANSTVVNPLTTLVSALLDQNLTREEAKGKAVEALGVPESVDVFSYDPIAAASSGENGKVSTSTRLPF